jgi:S-DNA-T family DNA segregation ATPase FtsK/SpoIIIE
MLERRGVISGYEGSKPRQVLVTAADMARLTSGGGEPQQSGAEAPAAVPE